MKNIHRSSQATPLFSIVAILGISLGLGAVFQAISGKGGFWPGFWASSFLFFLSLGLMWFAWRSAGRGKALAWIMILAFLLRLALGLFLGWGLPRFGYDQSVQQAGFVFEDAYRRDGSAWELAMSGDTLMQAFSEAYGADQYGGMLALSAMVYRFLSPDAYRPGLILILTSGAMALGVPFLVATTRRRFDGQVALWTGWIFALYPEGILLGASQMREPFYLLFFCILFWAASHWLDRSRLRLALPLFALTSVAFLLFSYRIGIPVIGVILIWLWLETVPKIRRGWMKILGWGLVVVGAGAALFIFRDWLIAALNWDTYLTIHASGMVQFQLERLPEWMYLPFLVGYGLFQPVLPAAISIPAPWIWKGLGIFRALGWYAILPLLIYALFRVWKEKPDRTKRLLVMAVLFVLGWILLASVRAGGDQWDNPRYRTAFLPWMAFLSAWGVQYSIQNKDRWLRRWLIIEGVALGILTVWYVSRYTAMFPPLDLQVMIGMIFLVGLLIIVMGWLHDKRQKIEDLTDEDEKL